MARVIFLTLGMIVLVLGLGGATVDSDGSLNLLLRDLGYIAAGIVLALAAIASAIAERTRQAAPPQQPQAWARPPQPAPGVQPPPGVQPAWGPMPPHGGQPR
jgi:hypothetical protein